MRPCFTPPKVNFTTHSPANRPNSKGRVYSNLPASNINTAALSLYGEVRGKYSRNAFKTINSLPNTTGLVSRPSTAGSLQKYSRKGHSTDSKNRKLDETSPASKRPLPYETRVRFADEVVNYEKNGKREEGTGNYQEDCVKMDDLAGLVKENEDGGKNDRENGGNEGNENRDCFDDPIDLVGEEEIEEKDFGKKTEVSFRTSKSQIRYIEELEKLIQEERSRRIQAEEKFQKEHFTRSRKKKIN